MTPNEKAVLVKALNKAASMGLGITDTVNLIELYQDLIGDMDHGPVNAIVSQSGIRPLSLSQREAIGLAIPSPAPPPVVPMPPPVPTKPMIILSSTSSIQSGDTTQDRTLQEHYDELKGKVPDFIDVLGPGRTVPARFKVEVYKREAEGIVPASFGVVLSAAGDPSKVEGKFSYDMNKPYDVDKDIADFRESILHMYKNAGKKLTPMLPPVQLPPDGMGEQWA